MVHQDLDLAAAARVAVEALKERATVVGTVSMPTLSPPRSPIRARDEMCLFIVGACERTACCTCEPVVAGKELRGVCMCIYLVFSCSISTLLIVFSLNPTP